MPIPEDLKGRHLGDEPQSLGDSIDFFNRPQRNTAIDALRVALAPTPDVQGPIDPRQGTVEAEHFPVTSGRFVESFGNAVGDRIEGVQSLAQMMANLPNMTSKEVLGVMKGMTDQLMAQAARNLVGTMTRGAEYIQSELHRDPGGAALELAEFLPVGRLGKFPKMPKTSEVFRGSKGKYVYHGSPYEIKGGTLEAGSYFGDARTARSFSTRPGHANEKGRLYRVESKDLDLVGADAGDVWGESWIDRGLAVRSGKAHKVVEVDPKTLQPLK